MDNNKKVFLLLGCGCVVALLAAILVAAILGVGVFSSLFGLLKQSEPFEDSFRRTSTHPAATAALGSPVEAGFLVSGSIQLDNDAGSADLNYSVSGPKGKGTVFVTGTKGGGAWTYSRMELKVDGSGEAINLLANP